MEEIEQTPCKRACCFTPYGVCAKSYRCQHHADSLTAARAKSEAAAYRAELAYIWGKDGMGRGLN